ncbi:MAG: hypothetical protein ABL921_35545, partial [Pirellula sp.]
MTTMKAPDQGVAIRMYRQGHGDCFLMAFPRSGGGDPGYVVIDCGYKPGSQTFLHDKSIGDIVDHIGEATDHRIDLMIVTHEHQDHCNGIWKKNSPYFQDFTIQEAWFAWTEDPNDELAKELRAKHKDQLLSLLHARKSLALAVGSDDSAVHRLDNLLSLEMGDTDTGSEAEMFAAATDPTKSTNKQAMKLVKDKAEKKRGVKYFSPGDPAADVFGTKGVRAFVLGPPRAEDLLTDEDPVGEEGFPGDHSITHGLTFAAAAMAGSAGENSRKSPFRSSYCVPADQAMAFMARGRDDQIAPFFSDRYGSGPDPDGADNQKEVATNAKWRRIDADWLYTAENIALQLNRGINNTSLVLAFELPTSKKILLFVGDAQRGNWISWSSKKNEWKDGETTVTARDLLARTVLYKCGHHGSHNATLNGTTEDNYANLSWMGHGVAANEFTSMITAVNEWAMTKNDPP